MEASVRVNPELHRAHPASETEAALLRRVSRRLREPDVEVISTRPGEVHVSVGVHHEVVFESDVSGSLRGLLSAQDADYGSGDLQVAIERASTELLQEQIAAEVTRGRVLVVPLDGDRVRIACGDKSYEFALANVPRSYRPVVDRAVEAARQPGAAKVESAPLARALRPEATDALTDASVDVSARLRGPLPHGVDSPALGAEVARLQALVASLEERLAASSAQRAVLARSLTEVQDGWQALERLEHTDLGEPVLHWRLGAATVITLPERLSEPVSSAGLPLDGPLVPLRLIGQQVRAAEAPGRLEDVPGFSSTIQPTMAAYAARARSCSLEMAVAEDAMDLSEFVAARERTP